MGAVREELDLRPLLAPLRRLGFGERELARVATAAARAAYESLRESFRSGTDPDGRPWKPVQKTTGKALVETGRMRSRTKARVDGGKVVAECTDPKAEFHQYGTRTIPARRFVGFGSRFRREFRRLLDELVAQATPE